MTLSSSPTSAILNRIRLHGRVIWALLLRELATRYGRDNIGFLWIVCEPLVFCTGVLILWSIARPPFDHGIRVIPFTLTGYMPTILMRHMISHGLNTLKVNAGLLYHRQITLLHLFVARSLLEFFGVTLAFVTACVVLYTFGTLEAPKDFSIVYEGWGILALMSLGITMIFGALAEIVDIFEKFGQLFTYIMMPISGAFWMVSWVPQQYWHLVLKIPFLHGFEMIRAGFFGSAVQAHYSIGYALTSAGVLIFIGLLLLRFVRNRLDIE